MDPVADEVLGDTARVDIALLDTGPTTLVTIRDAEVVILRHEAISRYFSGERFRSGGSANCQSGGRDSIGGLELADFDGASK